MEYRLESKNDEEVFKAVSILMKGVPVHSIMSLEKSKRDMIIVKAKKIEGVTQRQLARVLGISPNLVFKAKRKKQANWSAPQKVYKIGTVMYT